MTTLPAKRACDACHRRKIRCIGSNPCQNCSQASLSCTYNAVPRKKGPKGNRAKVISELRASQHYSHLRLKVQKTTNDDFDTHGSSLSPTQLRSEGLLSSQMVQECVDFFFENLYPTMPVLDRQTLLSNVQDLDHSLETYLLITSLCAFMMIQPEMKLPGSFVWKGQVLEHGKHTSGVALLEEVHRLRRGAEYIESPTLETILASFFLFACYFGLDKHNIAWFYLREATTLTEILGMQYETTYGSGDMKENSRKRRIYWLLFVTERSASRSFDIFQLLTSCRAYALQRHRPLTLQGTIKLPTLDDEDDEKFALSGFIHLVNLFQPFDDTFVGLWNKARNDCSPVWLAMLQRQLAEVLPPDLDTTETQVADLRTTQQWLRTMVWQLSITNSYLSSTSVDPSMTLIYPIEISRDLVSVTNQLSLKSMEVHGTGLVSCILSRATQQLSYSRLRSSLM